MVIFSSIEEIENPCLMHIWIRNGPQLFTIHITIFFVINGQAYLELLHRCYIPTLSMICERETQLETENPNRQIDGRTNISVLEMFCLKTNENKIVEFNFTARYSFFPSRCVWMNCKNIKTVQLIILPVIEFFSKIEYNAHENKIIQSNFYQERKSFEIFPGKLCEIQIMSKMRTIVKKSIILEIIFESLK